MIKDGKYTILETRGAVAKITINRPEKRNALNRDTIREILAVFEELRTDDSIAVVLTTGAGSAGQPAGVRGNEGVSQIARFARGSKFKFNGRNEDLSLDRLEPLERYISRTQVERASP